MPITTTVRLVNANNAADRAFCVNAAAFAGLLWDEDTVRSYANSPDFDLAILLGSWPERGQLIARVEQIVAPFQKTVDNGGRLRGTPDSVVGVFPGEASVTVYNLRADNSGGGVNR